MENPDFCTESYLYDLPTHFIADRPAPGRDSSKLMVYFAKSDVVKHVKFKDLPQFLSSDDLLVMNNTKVFPCRLFGNKASGGAVELFILSLVPINNLYPVMIRSNGKKHVGDVFHFENLQATLKQINSAGDFLVSFNLNHQDLLDFLNTHANIPIPPYIRDGIADEKDLTDYQTIYAKELGSVAAPTAGLHFTQKVFDDLEKAGIKKSFVTLQVGVGTFKPVTANNILEHNMHSELFSIDQAELKIINQYQSKIAVGTTTLRVLESCYIDGQIKLPKGDAPFSTNIFLYPGVDVKSIRGLITNFHLPKSTLLMLVSSLIGREKTLELYEIAKEQDYRFFSYGDAMLILRNE